MLHLCTYFPRYDRVYHLYCMYQIQHWEQMGIPNKNAGLDPLPKETSWGCKYSIDSNCISIRGL